MDSLSVYFNAIWQEAQRPLPKVERPNTSADLIAFARQLRRVPKLIYSAVTHTWQPRD
tara:strand:+ start:3091 stop:3264 length:174 start_codon:yes stop_codon:yes gene_type:complete